MTTADRAPEGLSEEERDLAMVCDAYGLPHDVLALARHLASGADLDHRVNTETIRILNARLAEQGAVIARVEALAEMWEGIHATIAPVLGEPPQGQVIAHAEQLRAALRPDPSAQGAGEVERRG